MASQKQKVISFGGIPDEPLKMMARPKREELIRQSIGSKLFGIIEGHVGRRSFSEIDYGGLFTVQSEPDEGPSAQGIISLFERSAPLAGVQVTILMPFMRERRVVDAAIAAGARAFSTLSVGVDHFDLPYLAERGVPVFHCCDVLTDCMAQHTLSFILPLANNICRGDAWLRQGKWGTLGNRETQRAMAIEDLYKSTVGIIGLGRIGTRLMELLAPFGPDILWNDIKPELIERQDEKNERYLAIARQNGYEPAIRYLPLDEMIPRCDVLVMCADLNPTSVNLMNADRIGAMKPGAIFVNTTRGGLVDNAALRRALRQGHLGGAGLDVFDEEPLSENTVREMASLPNVLANPHLGTDRFHTRLSMWYMALYSLLGYLAGRRPTNVANPQAYSH